MNDSRGGLGWVGTFIIATVATVIGTVLGVILTEPDGPDLDWQTISNPGLLRLLGSAVGAVICSAWTLRGFGLIENISEDVADDLWGDRPGYQRLGPPFRMRHQATKTYLLKFGGGVLLIVALPLFLALWLWVEAGLLFHDRVWQLPSTPYRTPGPLFNLLALRHQAW
jgi:hypothetical protein